MFTVTLKNGTSFAATSVQESYNLANLFSASPWRLSIEDSSSQEGLDSYRELLEAPGALETLTVSCGGEDSPFTPGTPASPTSPSGCWPAGKRTW